MVGQRNQVVERRPHINGRREIDDRRLAAQRVQDGIGDDQARQRLEAQRCELQHRGPVAHDSEEVDGRGIERGRIVTYAQRHRMDRARETGMPRGVDGGTRGRELRGAGNGHQAEIHTSPGG